MAGYRRTGTQPPHSRAAASPRAKTSIVALASASAIALLALSLLSPVPGARAVTIYASDTYNRTVTNGWGTADTGGAWTVAGAAANWSVAPVTGSVNVPANGQERGYLGSVAVQDVEVTAKIVLPRSTQSNNAIAYLLGRDSGATGNYYRVGVGQGTGSTIVLRTQRSDGTSLGGDLATGITAADGAIVWLRVQFEGVNPTAIRARAWRDGTAEPSAWLLNVTDSNAAQQISGDVGVRMRNEDAAAAHTFWVQSFTATSFVGAPPPTPTPTSPPPTATPTSPPPGPLATDTFARSATGAWNSADTGGPWTTLGSPWNWSVSPGAGTIAAAANADERGYLSAVNARDVDITEQVVLPRSGQANNALAYVIGRFVAAYNPTYYAVGVGQGTGANIMLRAQRSAATGRASALT